MKSKMKKVTKEEFCKGLGIGFDHPLFNVVGENPRYWHDVPEDYPTHRDFWYYDNDLTTVYRIKVCFDSHSGVSTLWCMERDRNTHDIVNDWFIMRSK